MLLRAQYDRVSACAPDAPGARGARRMKTQALAYLAASDPGLAADLAMRQYHGAANMTDRQGALMVLCGLETSAREECLADFHRRFAGNALEIGRAHV